MKEKIICKMDETEDIVDSIKEIRQAGVIIDGFSELLQKAIVVKDTCWEKLKERLKKENFVSKEDLKTSHSIQLNSITNIISLQFKD